MKSIDNKKIQHDKLPKHHKLVRIQRQTTIWNHFKIYEEDKTIIYKLIAYSLQDQKMVKRCNINLEKGILLSGPIGCGKTTLMTLLKFLVPKEKNTM